MDGVCYGTELFPVTGSYDEQRGWTRIDKAVQGIFLLTVESKIRRCILACNTSFEMWSRLKCSYGPIDTYKQDLWNQFYEMEVCSETGPLEVLYQLEVIAGQLNTLKPGSLTPEDVLARTIRVMKGEQICQSCKTDAGHSERDLYAFGAKSKFNGGNPKNNGKGQGQQNGKEKRKPGTCHNCENVRHSTNPAQIMTHGRKERIDVDPAVEETLILGEGDA
ncbi:unnamed protein product, partial [Allacma fusca]